jgi:hypothetical protein
LRPPVPVEDCSIVEWRHVMVKRGGLV